MMRLIFLGPPGAGKGTQARILTQALGIPHLSTGELLRDAAGRRTAIGIEAETYMSLGQLVPDELVERILRERLQAPETARGFLLDGYPRSLSQAHTLSQMTAIDRAIYFDLPERELIERLTQRMSCPRCGSLYNLATQRPRDDKRCDRDGVDLVQRADDQPQAVRMRLKLYSEHTIPLLDHYRRRGILRTVDARGDVDEVARRIAEAVRAR